MDRCYISHRKYHPARPLVRHVNPNAPTNAQSTTNQGPIIGQSMTNQPRINAGDPKEAVRSWEV